MAKQEEKSIGELFPDGCENHTGASAQSPVPKDALRCGGVGIEDYFFLVGFFSPLLCLLQAIQPWLGTKGAQGWHTVAFYNHQLHGLRFLRYVFASGSPLQGALRDPMNELVMPPMAWETLLFALNPALAVKSK